MNLDKAKEINSSPFWEMVVAEIDESKIKPLVNRLTSCSIEDLVSIQIRIKVWEEAKRLPRDAIDRQE